MNIKWMTTDQLLIANCPTCGAARGAPCHRTYGPFAGQNFDHGRRGHNGHTLRQREAKGLWNYVGTRVFGYPLFS